MKYLKTLIYIYVFSMALRDFIENIECVEKHLEFVFENLHEILEKLDSLDMKDWIMTIQEIRSRILEYYKIIQEIKHDMVKNQNLNHIDSLIDIRKKLRVVRKILHLLKNDLIEKKDFNDISVQSFIEEIMDCRGNIYAAERHLSEFISALIFKQKAQQTQQQENVPR